jgi:predicted HTH domain antitoxin
MKVVLEFPEKPELRNLNIAQYLASKMYQDGILSAGQAAQLVGKSKEKFLEELGNFGVSIFSESADDFLKDIKNA